MAADGRRADAEITVDAHGNALADGGISATLRDAGRVGLLALGRGRVHGAQVIPEAWLDDTITGAPDGQYAFPGRCDRLPTWRPLSQLLVGHRP